MQFHLPSLTCDDQTVNRAFRIAVGDFTGNIAAYHSGLLDAPAPVILAGLDYNTPWTRDASFNTWYAGAMICPEVARNTLLAVAEKRADGKLYIGGEYWDSIIWVWGAWQYYLHSGDRDFLSMALEISLNSLADLEDQEFDPKDGLFRGGACFQDGISAYPDRYVSGPGNSGIMHWPSPGRPGLVPRGHGIPVKAFSTNCLYYKAYRLAAEMRQELRLPVAGELTFKAEQLKKTINLHFWNSESNAYRYFVDPGEDETKKRQEGLGNAFALLFDIANAGRVDAVLSHQHITQQGIPCVWPHYERYTPPGTEGFPRHSGTIWPQVNAAWAVAAVRHQRPDLAWNELKLLADKACRDLQFAEIYHPVTGHIYGGLQEKIEYMKTVEWKSCDRQTWCATGFIKMVTEILAGIRLETDGFRCEPYLPPEMDHLRIDNLHFRNSDLSIEVKRGTTASQRINGRSWDDAYLPWDSLEGKIELVIVK